LTFEICLCSATAIRHTHPNKFYNCLKSSYPTEFAKELGSPIQYMGKHTIFRGISETMSNVWGENK